MAITLRVVGIFYENPDILLPSGSTVEAVLQYAQANPRGSSTSSSAVNFAYSDSAAGGFASVTSFSTTYDRPFTSITTGNPYPIGDYFLAENVQTSPVYSVWQFYVQDANRVPVVYFPRVTYFDQPNAIVPDNGFVTWRLVNLLAGPNLVPKQVRQRLS